MNVEQPPRSSVRTRALSFVALAGTAAVVTWVGVEAYHAATDSFVAPILLSPDNDMIVASKLKVAEFRVERQKSIAERDAIDDDVAAIDTSIDELEKLRATNDDALGWTSELNAQKLGAASSDLAKLGKAHDLLGGMLVEQRKTVAKAKANVDAGVIVSSDYDKEVQTMNQLTLGLIENERTQIETSALAGEARLTERSLASARGAPMMPERLVREEQKVRISLEITKLKADRRTKLSERRVLVDKLAVLDGLEHDLKARPIFRAVESSVDAAFVPYTQMGDLKTGHTVFACVGGIVMCKPVGTVAEIVPGEVILPDPWGNQARGQYVVLDLRDHTAMMHKTLRLRDTGAAPPSATKEEQRVSSR